ncbi:hypothetical protein MRX96_016339 [Rhipicephalus microplus]
MGARASSSGKLSRTASRTRTPGSVTPEPKTTGVRGKVPKANPQSPRSKKRFVPVSGSPTPGTHSSMTSRSVSPYQTPGTSSPMTVRMEPTDEKRDAETAAGNDGATPVASSTSQVAVWSVTPLSVVHAEKEERQAKPKIPNHAARSTPTTVSPLSLSVTAPMPTTSPALNVPDREREPVMVAILSAVALVMTVVAITMIWLTSARLSFPKPKNATEDTFCCPVEAAQLRAVIDVDVSPCRDFFAYVCKRAIQDDAVQVGVAMDTLVRTASCKRELTQIL